MKTYLVKVIYGPHSASTDSVIADELVTSNGCHYFYLGNEVVSIYPVNITVIVSISKSE